MDETVRCPHCGAEIPRTVKPGDEELFAEHCDSCFLPFDIDPTTREGVRP